MILIGFIGVHLIMKKRFYSHVDDIEKNLKKLEESLRMMMS